MSLWIYMTSSFLLLFFFFFFFFKFYPSSPVIYFQLVLIIQTEGSKMSVCPSLVFFLYFFFFLFFNMGNVEGTPLRTLV